MKKLTIVEGLPCSVKSTTSKYIAKKLNAKHYDENSGIHSAEMNVRLFCIFICIV